ncbi:hypothetical protein MSSAC_1005 [Methanosarcina siciliae C2J]|uniref:Uncharacterized protein n=1 Tax=Methanosarcina siciliae C2J TaxID=1434118 RepID=A0A0E3PKC3_9EURY|nr:hypothetical protein [Methanosarcina siciliae]AKB35595.1 hypothetical protein MSSAC_1005 [Methanosarcina siciliae C2J]
MSEELTQKTPISSQNSTHSGSISLPDLNLSIPVHIHLTADPALHAALEKIAAVLSAAGEPIYYGLNREQTAELVEKGIVNSVMTGLDPAQKDEKIEAESEKFPSNPEKSQQNLKKTRKNVKWTDIPKHSHLRYRTEEGKLILNYAGSIVETTWQQMEKASKVDQKYQKQEIEKILGARRASNRKAAISLFLKLIEKGDIKVPTPNEEFEKNFQQFQSEEEASA